MPRIASILSLVLLLVLPVQAQRAAKKSNPASDLAKARESLAKATDEYKASLASLIELLERDAEAVSGEVEKRRSLFASGIVSKREVEESELKLAKVRAEIEAKKKEMADADQLLVEAEEADQLALAVPRRRGYSSVSSAVIRYGGGGGWNLTAAGKVQSFFATRFGRVMPISAYGQTGLHNRLGFDHRNAIDVPVHPDSAEGQALMAYLRQSGIPFLAFRHQVPGKATGAHIHIGYPSRRL